MITRTKPGMTRKAKPRPPEMIVKTALVIAFVVSAIKMGSAALVVVIFPAPAKVATEIAAGPTLATPADAAVAATPEGPSHFFMALEANRTAVSMAAKIVAAHGLNAWPCASTPPISGARQATVMPAASPGRVTASPPSNVAETSAASVVRPGSSVTRPNKRAPPARKFQP
jgi:hypothetical protein